MAGVMYKVDCYRCALFEKTEDYEEAERIRDSHEHKAEIGTMSITGAS